MFTPQERRGAIVLLALVALGAGWDLFHREPGRVPPLAALGLAAEGTAPAAAGVDSARSAGMEPAPRVLDLNAASAAQLDELPGIGPVLARRIVEARTRAGGFRAPEELMSVRGIGPRLYAKLRPRVAVSRTSARTEGVQDARHRAR